MKKMTRTAKRHGSAWGLRTFLLLLVTGALVACGGGGSGGGDGTNGPVDPPVNSGDTYSVSGNINGLTGPVRISDGFQTLDIAADGEFAFAHPYKKADTFAITVDTGATDQLCTLTHGAGLILGDIDDVSIDCLELREANIRVIKPTQYTAFSQLGLRSSYQSIPQLAGETSTLVVAKNQFVTVSTSTGSPAPVYLAFIKSFEETQVDAFSTAVSLVLLSPSIHGAIEERDARFEFFANRFAELTAIKALGDALKLKADAGKLNLLAPSQDLLPLLDAAVVAAAANITASDAAASKLMVSARDRAAQKLVVTPINGTQNGISLALTKITPDSAGNNYQLQIDNSQQRFVAVESALLPSPIAMAPGGSQLQPLKSTDSDGVLLTVLGPGGQAATAPVPASLKQAVIDTASQFYVMPSLAFTTGRLDAFGWRLLACVDTTELQEIRDATNSDLQASTLLNDALLSPQYTAAYDAVATPLRASIANHLAELLACEFFRKGHWLDEHADTAEAQIGTILNIAQGLYAPGISRANVLITTGLLSAGDVITTSMTAQQWQLSNKLAIDVTQTRNGATLAVTSTAAVNEGEALVLIASCRNPADSKPAACSLRWTSAQGTTNASTLNEVPTSSGIVTVSATDEDGASASLEISVTVTPPEPPVGSGYWIERDGTTERRLDIVAVEFTPADVNNPGVSGLAQIRGFSGTANDDPQIRLSLPQFSGAGTYVLDDLEPGRECLGFVTVNPPDGSEAPQAWDQLWCTKTIGPFAASPATGTAIYNVDPQGFKSVDFDFQVVPTGCPLPSSCAARRQITGHINVP
jgi:hypothetical protein